MMIRVKMIITLSVDKEEYPIPADGNVGEEVEDYIKDMIYDLEGIKIRAIKTITEEKQMLQNYLPTDYQNFIALSRYAR